MNFNEIKELIKIVDESQLRSFQLNLDGASISMSKNEHEYTVENVVNNTSSTTQSVQAPVVVAKDDVSVAVEAIQTVDTTTGNIIKSPIVGTFYSSAKPGAPALKSKGDTVKKGEVICIVEAMKIMNEITSEFDGIVQEIFVSNEDLVEFGQPLFKIV